jgi:hypothetical protein
MMQPPLTSGITFTQPAQWVWHVSLDGKRVGTVNGDSVLGFVAKDMDHHSIGQRYVTAEAAMQAWVPVRDCTLDGPTVPTVEASRSRAEKFRGFLNRRAK